MMRSEIAMRTHGDKSGGLRTAGLQTGQQLALLAKACRYAAAPRQSRIAVLGGRMAVILAILMFIAVYALSFAKAGLVLGIAIGWLPAAVMAWVTAQLISTFVDHFERS